MGINLTFVGQLLTFGAMVWFVRLKLWPSLFSILETRRQRIAEGLIAAEEGFHKVKQAEKFAEQKLQDTKHKAQELLRHAQQQVEELLKTGRAQLEQERSQSLQEQLIQIRKLEQQSRQALEHEVVEVALRAVQILLSEEALDPQIEAKLRLKTIQAWIQHQSHHG